MKRLIVCSDGTWNKLTSSYPTNVVKIAQAVQSVSDDIPQIVFYDEGIGTEDWTDKLAGGAFGRGIDRHIQNAYRFLVLNYEPDDQIYLFGFSRGAYTVRSLAGMIYCSGLLERQYIRHAPQAYEIYRICDKNIRQQNARKFREQYNSTRVNITLMGCFDTVGALGIPDLTPWLPIDHWINKKYQFHDTELSPTIQHALHAVAIDEIRKVYNVTPMHKSGTSTTQVLHQLWFPGNHGCVGGGDARYQGLSDGALIWMIREIQQLGLGLKFDLNCIEDGLAPNPTINFDNYLGKYAATGVIRRTVTGNFDDLHESVKQRWCSCPGYRPQNLDKYQQALEAYRAEHSEILVGTV